jgi:phosphoenolpyruvate synthase/pyruvate phosphate dikinase
VTAGGYSSALESLRGEDRSSFGGKSASLGELLTAGIPVPPGFALSAEAYGAFLNEAGLRAVVAGGDSESIRTAIRAASIPDGVCREIEDRYGALGEPPVAVRSSALGEDSEEATFAGQQESYLWVRGAGAVADAVRDCWASLYTPEAVSYRARLGFTDDVAMGVTVQAMVDAEVSGVMFTCNPLSGDPSVVAINASWGLGLAVVGGEVTPDDYLLSKVTGETVRVQVAEKHVEYVADSDGHGATRKQVAPERANARCLDDDALRSLVEMARRVERHFGSRQDIEWALARGEHPPDNLYILQSRPVTAVAKPDPKSPPKSAISAVMSTFGANVSRRG